jgi:hypothetical protein
MNYRVKHIIEKRHKGQKDKEEDVSSHWMTLRNRADTGNSK